MSEPVLLAEGPLEWAFKGGGQGLHGQWAMMRPEPATQEHPCVGAPVSLRFKIDTWLAVLDLIGH